MFCYKCGAMLPDGAVFCPKCGCKIESSVQAAIPNEKPKANPTRKVEDHAAPMKQPRLSGPSVPIENTDGRVNLLNERANIFIGKNATYYFQKESIMRANGSKISWNWAGFFFSAYWAFYRKMFHVGIPALAANISIFFITEFILPTLGFISLAPILSFVGQLSILVIVGMYGNHFYMKHVNEYVTKSKQMNDEEWSRFAQKNGGTSIGMIMIPIGIWLLVSFIAHYLYTEWLYSFFFGL